MSRLYDDECRCHDEVCPDKRGCMRWIERERGGPRTPHSWSLYPLPGPSWQPQMLLDRSAPCPYRIASGAQDEDAALAVEVAA